MTQASDIRAGMEVVGADGAHVGVVERVVGDRIRLVRAGAADDRTHDLPLAAIDAVDDRVRLTMSGAAALSIAGAPASGLPGDAIATESIVPPVHNRAVAGAPARGNFYLPWIVGLVGLVLLLLLLLRACQPHAVTAPSASNATPAPTTGALPVTQVKLPDGTTVGLQPQTLPFELQAFLASADPAPRTFTFDRLNFDTAAAAIRPDDAETVDVLARVLTAYPAARATLVGYTDARGTAGGNADLGARRAQAVADALAAKGIARDRLGARSGGESDPVASNATPGGRFANRRTELVVTAK